MTTRTPWTATILDVPTTQPAAVARSIGTSLALAAIFGAAMGARYGELSMAVHAVGVPLGLAAVIAIGGPAFFVGCAHAGVAIGPRDLLRSLTAGLATSGLVLAGSSPAMLLGGVSAETPFGAGAVAGAGLALGGLVGLRRALVDMGGALKEGGVAARLAAWSFGAFAVVLATRIWWLALPALGRPLLEGTLGGAS